MFNIPSVAVGAIVAALIAAVISLLGLIISKEQKTSEFRQAWVDALRDDLSNYLTQINAICDGVSVSYETQAKKVEALAPAFREINRATFNISLRLNREELLAQEVIANMVKLHHLTLDHSTISPDKIRPIESELLISAQKLLKSEWSRVKRGEPTFVAAKFAALAVVVFSIALCVVQLAQHSHSRTREPITSTAPEPGTRAKAGIEPPESGVDLRAPT